ncbi:MAG: sterol desaturase family protein [Gammaproteobacteria bacterium]
MEALIRVTAFAGIFLILISWELYLPRRTLSSTRLRRWPVNLGLGFFNTLLLRVTVGGIAYQSANAALEHSWGLLNWLAAPGWFSIVFTFLLLDFAIYLQHILFHKWPLLWRLHQVHHTDLDFDATTAVRFHPLEIVISMAYKVACIFAIGADPATVIAFEIILNGCAMFNHSNIAIPEKADRLIRLLIITPDMHRIHHSTVRKEIDSNYGFSVSFWDRLCRTYTDRPSLPHTEMEIGLKSYRDPSDLSWIKLMRLPFRRQDLAQ